MNTQQLLFKFNQGINWNAILSITHKILSVIVSYILFCTCSTADYNLWANAQGLIFITLLWIDGGLRKSIPRFAPIFASTHTTPRFIKYISVFQITALLCTVPLIILGSQKLHSVLSLSYSVIPYIIMLFLLEGIISLLRLIYHSYFWHKVFNETYVSMIMLETMITLLLVALKTTPLIPSILITKIITGSILIIITTWRIPAIMNDPAYKDIKANGITNPQSEFLTHTAAMWGSNAIKSMSERNALMPIFTYMFGPEQANLFKVANDGAVVVYRTLIKTIGTTDTSLLAHSQVIGAGESGLQAAFKKVSTKVASLCIPVLGIIGGIYSSTYWYLYDHVVFHIMFILIGGYVIEVALSSYERVLEINFRYRYLVYAYIPYIVLLTLFLIPLLSFITIPTLTPLSLTLSSILSIDLSSLSFDLSLSRITSIGLVPLLLCMHGVRLVSTSLMVCFARRLYTLSFPLTLRECYMRFTLFFVAGAFIGIGFINLRIILT